MKNLLSGAEGSEDLFGKLPRLRVAPSINGGPQPELTAARALCRRLRSAPARREKQQIAHLICLNLVSMLRRGAKQ
jgi:hypothetical protein